MSNTEILNTLETNKNTPIEINKKKIYGFDPILVAINIALLKFCPTKTRLYYYMNTIALQLPGFTQKVARKIYGNTKEESKNLYVPLRKCVDYYILDKKDTHVRNILPSTIDGLIELQKTYKDFPNTVMNLQLMIDIIRDGLNNNKKDHDVLKFAFGDFDENPIYEELWNELSMNVLNSHLENCLSIFKNYEEYNLSTDSTKRKDFDDKLSKLKDFINAKEKRYLEFLEKKL